MIQNSAYGMLYYIGVDNFINMEKSEFYRWLVEHENEIDDLTYDINNTEEYFDFLKELLEGSEEKILKMMQRLQRQVPAGFDEEFKRRFCNNCRRIHNVRQSDY
jgi:hypothetical protein